MKTKGQKDKGCGKDNGNQVPDWIEGTTVSKKNQAYAASLKNKAETLFPAISLLADVKRSSRHALGNVDRILNALEKRLVSIFSIFSLSKYTSISLFVVLILSKISFRSPTDSKDIAIPFTNVTNLPQDASSFNFPELWIILQS